MFASLFGTLALLDAADQALVAGFVINKFRGDAGLLAPGLDMLRALTGRPTYGVLPFHLDLWLDAEDSLAYGRLLGRPGPARGSQWLRVAVVRLPRISNATDAEALAVEPGVRVRLTIEPAELADADLVVLPGSKSTVDDLAWLRATGLADAVLRHAARGPAGARHLRRVPDAGRAHPRRGGEPPGHRARARPAAGRDHLRRRRRRSARPSGRAGAASGAAGTRSTTGSSPPPRRRRRRC